MAIEAGTSTYYQAKRGIVQDGLVLHLDAGVKESYSGGDKIYDLKNLDRNGVITPTSSIVKGRKNVGIKYHGTSGLGAFYMYTSAYNFAMNNQTYLFYMKCEQASAGYGSFDNWIIQLGGYYANNSFGLGLQGPSFMIYAKGSTTSGWSYGSVSTSGGTIYSNNLGEWIFYVIKFSEGGTGFKVYMNNTLVFNVPTSISDAFTGINSSGRHVFGRLMKSTFGSLMVYNTILDDNQIAQIYNSTRHRFGL